MFIDGCVYSLHKTNGQTVVEDWLPGIFSTLGLIMLNLISKDKLNGNDFSYASDSNTTLKGRLIFFLGLSTQISSLGGAISSFVIKNIKSDGIQEYLPQTVLVQNILIFISSLALWAFRNYEEYSI